MNEFSEDKAKQELHKIHGMLDSVISELNEARSLCQSAQKLLGSARPKGTEISLSDLSLALAKSQMIAGHTRSSHHDLSIVFSKIKSVGEAVKKCKEQRVNPESSITDMSDR